jgi:hypothetical protein
MATPDELWDPMVQVESGGDPNRIGGAGEIGLVQIKPSTAADYGVSPEALRHPEVQRMLFNRIMGKYLARYGDVPRAVAAWNAGQHAVDMGRIPFSTRGYVNKVLALYNQKPGAMASLAPAMAPVRKLIARAAPLRNYQLAAFTSPLTDRAQAAEPPEPAEAVPATEPAQVASPPSTHPAVKAATGYLEDRMGLVLMTMGVPQRVAQLYAGAYASSYMVPGATPRLLEALGQGMTGLNGLIATDAPKVHGMTRI